MARKSSPKSIALIAVICTAFVLYHKYFTYNTDYKEENKKNGKTCLIPDFEDLEQFYSYFEKPKAQCHNKVQVGGETAGNHIQDGRKWICFDKGFKPYNCFVYSFGINNEWSFDDDMDSRLCQVFAFDPTMKVKDHKRSERISFFKLGISNYKGHTTMMGQNCSMDRYRGIVERLGHTSTEIDYLKMDIETSEIPVFMDILNNDLDLLDNVRQIGLEIHPGNPSRVDREEIFKRAKDYWEIFHRLECLGWRLLSAEMNQVPANQFKFRELTRSCCYEVVWIKF